MSTVKINGVTYEGVNKVEIPLAENTDQMKTYINTDGATAKPENVKAGDIFYAGGEEKTGTMPENEVMSKTLDTTDISVDIPEGIHKEGGKVQISVETKSATPTKAAQNITPSAGKVLSKVTVAKIPDKYQDVSGVTAGAGDVVAGKIIVAADGTPVEGTHTDPQITLASGILSIK